MVRVFISTALLALLSAPVAHAAGQRSSPGPEPAGPALDIPSGAHWLGTIRIPTTVRTEDGTLPPGTYRVRLTTETWKDAPAGASEALLRWVEFVEDGMVKGRTIASIVPATAVPQVVEGRVPPEGTLRVDRLRGDDDDLVRGWYNFGGDQVLIHLAAIGRPGAPVATSGAR